MKTTIFNEDRPGRSINTTLEDEVVKIENIVFIIYPRIRETVDAVNFSIERVQNILKENLGIKSIGGLGAAVTHGGTNTESTDYFGAVLGNKKQY